MKIDWIIGRCNEVLFGQEKKNIAEMFLDANDLDITLSEAARHGVLPIVMDSFSDVKSIPLAVKNVVIKWYGASNHTKNQYWNRLFLMEKLALAFKKEGMDVMFLKGATTARLYPRPQLRVFGDIDYYMFGESDKSVEVLKNMGIKTEEYFNHHTQASLDGILIENHYDFLDRDNHQGNLLLDDELKLLAATEGHKYPFKFENKEADNAYCMSPTMNAIFLMRHMAAHFFSETIPLRILYDWALFQQYYAKEVDWEKTLTLYKKAGMPVFTRLIQGILLSKLSLVLPECPIEPVYGEKMERVWKSIVESPVSNPYKKNSICYLAYEANMFLSNRWKHQLVFENESYWYLFFSYIWLYLRKKIKG